MQKLDTLQVILRISDIQLRLCMPKEQIHWTKKQFGILRDSRTNCCLLSTPSATFTQKSLQDSVSVLVQIQDTYE